MRNASNRHAERSEMLSEEKGLVRAVSEWLRSLPAELSSCCNPQYNSSSTCRTVSRSAV